MYPISAPVTAFLQQYRDNSDCQDAGQCDTPAVRSEESSQLPFLGEFISQSKDTCVEFCQALLLRSDSTRRNKNSSGDAGADATAANSATEGKVGKGLGSMVVLNSNTLVLFVHCAFLSQAAAAAAKRSATMATSGKAETFLNAFLDAGRCFTWSTNVSTVVSGDKPCRANKIRSLLLHSLIADARESAVGSADVSSVNKGTAAVTVTDLQQPKKQVLLFARQGAAPYVFCGRCSVASLEAPIGGALSADNVTPAAPPVSSVQGGGGRSNDRTRSAASVVETANVQVLFELTDYEYLMKAKAGDASSLYGNMIAQHTSSLL